MTEARLDEATVLTVAIPGVTLPLSQLSYLLIGALALRSANCYHTDFSSLSVVRSDCIKRGCARVRSCGRWLRCQPSPALHRSIRREFIVSLHLLTSAWDHWNWTLVSVLVKSSACSCHSRCAVGVAELQMVWFPGAFVEFDPDALAALPAHNRVKVAAAGARELAASCSFISAACLVMH